MEDGFNNDDVWRRQYERQMSAGCDQYADVIRALESMGLEVEFTQTGGMNAALEILLDGGYILVTDADDALAWNRREHRGWSAGVYLGHHEDARAVGFRQTEDSSIDGLLTLLDAVRTDVRNRRQGCIPRR